MTEHGLRIIVFGCGAIVELWILQWKPVDCMDDDEWIGNRHMGSYWVGPQGGEG